MFRRGTFIPPVPKSVSKEHTWYDAVETVIADNFLSDEKIDVLLNIISNYHLNKVTVFSNSEENAERIEIPNYIDHNIFNFMIDSKYIYSEQPSHIEIETLYWDILDKIRGIQEERWFMELRGLSPLVVTDIPRRVDIWNFEVGSHIDWFNNCTLTSKKRNKLMILIPLSDPQSYEGGEFEVFAGPYSKVIALTKGSLIAFPTYRYVRIKPIIKGSLNMICVMIMGVKNFR